MTTIQWPLDSAFSFLQQHPIEQLLFVEIMTSLPCHKLNWWIFQFFDNSSLLFAHSPLNFSIFHSLIQFPSTASIINSMDDSWVCFLPSWSLHLSSYTQKTSPKPYLNTKLIMHILKLYLDPCSLHESMSSPFSYSFRFWISGLSSILSL